MTGFKPRGQDGQDGQQEHHGQQGPDEQGAGEQAGGRWPGYRPPDHVPTEWVPRPEQFSPYQNPVLRPRQGQYPQSGQAPDPRASQWWDRQPWDLKTRDPEEQPQPEPQAVPRAPRNVGLSGAERFWYVLGCVAAGAAYLLKLPAKKAAAEILTELHRDGGGPGGPGSGYGLGGAETFWYVLLCFPFGGAYFAKVSAKRALWEMVTLLRDAPDAHRNALARALYGDQQR
jgi:hypothetical protein